MPLMFRDDITSSGGSNSWNDIINKPTSLLKIGQDNENKPTWNGQPWPIGITNIDWYDILNKPASTVANIDLAVSQTHIHANKDALDLLGKDINDNILWNGSQLPFGDMYKNVYDINDNGIVDKAETLHGLISTIAELNFLTGAKSNIQAQIDALSSVTNFKGAVPTYADISFTYPIPEDRNMVFVLEDETRDDKTTIYVYDGIDWVYVGTFDVEMRNFYSDPIKLDQEVIGVLDESMIDPLLVRRNEFTQTIAAIDDAALKKHEHSNKTILDNMEESFTTVLKTKLDGLEKYTHPVSHSPSIIIQDENNRFVTDTEKSTWNSKAADDHTHDDLHTHANKIVLDKITEDQNNQPLWNQLEWPQRDVDWSEILNIPTSTTLDIDDAVSKKHNEHTIEMIENLSSILSDKANVEQLHTHINFSILNNLSDISGVLHYLNLPIGGSGDGSGVSRFIQLLDTPQVYSGNENKYTKVNSNGTGLEFVELHTSTPSTNGILGAQVARRYSIIYGIG